MMKCIYCGEELKEGSLYCPKCGKAVQIVPDYNIYDDDYLNQVLTEESQKISGSRPDRNKNRHLQRQNIRGKNTSDPRQKKINLPVLGIVCVLNFALLFLEQQYVPIMPIPSITRWDWQRKHKKSEIPKMQLPAMKMHWHWIKTVLKSGWLWQNCIPKKTIMIRHLFYIRKCPCGQEKSSGMQRTDCHL